MKKIIYIFIIFTLCVFCRSRSPVDIEATLSIHKLNRTLFNGIIKQIFQRNKNFTLPVGKTELNIFDFDHTLADTETLLPVKTTSGNIELREPKCFYLRKGETANFEVNTREEMFKTKPIKKTFLKLKKHQRDPGASVIIITARGEVHTSDSIYRYIKKNGAEVDGILVVNTAFLRESLWEKIVFPDGIQKIPHGMKKTLLIAALIDIAGDKDKINLVRYREDSDKDIRGFLQFMPYAYPHIKIEAYDYIRRGEKGAFVYTEKFIARFEKSKLMTENGKIFTEAAKYNSGDCSVYKKSD